MAISQNTPEPDTTQSPGAEHSSGADASADPPVVEEILVEEVSIDGMCGVY